MITYYLKLTFKNILSIGKQLRVEQYNSHINLYFITKTYKLVANIIDIAKLRRTFFKCFNI